MKGLTKIQSIGNGIIKMKFKSPITLDEFIVLFVFGIVLIALTILNINKGKTLIDNILIFVPGVFGLLLLIWFFELVLLNFRTLIINKKAGNILFKKVISRKTVPISEVSHVLLGKKRNSGIRNNSGFKGSDTITTSIYLQLKNGKLVNLIQTRGVNISNKNAINQLNSHTKISATEIANLLNVKVKVDKNDFFW
ncbi:hypothetical protein [Algoriphagus pacificus]|uniref:PH domain-containing protein n=1 Tax=Algoriphagus pacificus TaxID=2811234 RepID=A0ABS3CI20_9BACT|nr:hypothetical protein [Algoriphagus pacificus]MBN7815806.1 hypothetical protein [Algoriphagus pacificus]